MNSIVLLLPLLAIALCAAPSDPVLRKLKLMPSLRTGMMKDGTWYDFIATQKSAGKSFNRTSRFWIDDLITDIFNLGTPPQEIMVLMDSTSGDSWVLDDTGCNEYDVGECPLFAPENSTTFKKGVNYYTLGGGNVGYVGYDVLTLDFPEETYPSQGFGVLSTRPIEHNREYNGVFGMAWPALSLNGLTPPLQNLAPTFAQPLWSIVIKRELDGNVEFEVIYMEWGGQLDGYCESDVNYITLSSKTYWQFPINGFKFGSYSVAKKSDAISDTTSTFMGVPTAAFSAIVKATGSYYDQGEQLYLMPCDGTYPNMTFTIGGQEYTVPSTRYVFDIGLNNGKCALAVYENAGTGGFGYDWVIGQDFMRTYCTTYDFGNGRIGFAKLIIDI